MNVSIFLVLLPHSPVVVSDDQSWAKKVKLDDKRKIKIYIMFYFTFFIFSRSFQGNSRVLFPRTVRNLNSSQVGNAATYRFPTRQRLPSSQQQLANPRCWSPKHSFICTALDKLTIHKLERSCICLGKYLPRRIVKNKLLTLANAETKIVKVAFVN